MSYFSSQYQYNTYRDILLMSYHQIHRTKRGHDISEENLYFNILDWNGLNTQNRNLTLLLFLQVP